jgi:hypothetical protein
MRTRAVLGGAVAVLVLLIAGAMAYINGPGDREGATYATEGTNDTYEVMISVVVAHGGGDC